MSSAFGWYYDFFSGQIVTQNVLFVRSSDAKLYRLQSYSSGLYGTWLSGSAGSGAFPGGEEMWLGTGGAASVGTILSASAVVYGVGGKLGWMHADTTLQEFRESGFRDHIRKGYSAVAGGQMLGNEGSDSAHANESTVSQNTLYGLASALRRQNPDGTLWPWRISAASTAYGGDDWDGDYVVAPVDGWSSYFGGVFPSMTDPYTAMDPTGSRGHHLALEVAITDNGGTPELTDCLASSNRRMVYRRGYGASAIASLTTPGSDLVVIESGSGIDHGNIAMAEESQGAAIHAAYWRTSDSNVRYWEHDPVSGPRGPYTVTGLVGTERVPGIFVDAANNVYIYTFSAFVPTTPRLCRVGSTGGCLQTGTFLQGVSGPSVADRRLHSFSVPMGAPGYPSSTFDAEEPFSFATDPAAAQQIYGVFEAWDPETSGASLSVYFSSNVSGSLNAWTDPVRVNLRTANDDRHFIDAELTVDREGTLVATYSAIEDGDTTASQYLAWSTDGGTNWTQTELASPGPWERRDLPWHCSRKRYFLGEYRQGGTVGQRAMHQLHGYVSDRTVLYARWANRWAVER